MKHSDSFVVTVDDNDQYHVVDKLELSKYSMKAQIDPATGSKQTVDEMFKVGTTILEPKYNPHDLVELLDLYTYHAACVDAVAVDASGVSYTLKPVEYMEPVEAEKERFIEVVYRCDDRKGNHRGGDNETGRNRVVFNVFDKAVFDTGGVFLEGEDETWKTDTNEV